MRRDREPEATQDREAEAGSRIRYWGRAALGALPLITVLVSLVAAFTYVMEYVYVWEFLSSFGVSPEDVGVNEFKLLTRAGVFALLFVPLVSALAVVCGLLAVQLLKEFGILARLTALRTWYRALSKGWKRALVIAEAVVLLVLLRLGFPLALASAIVGGCLVILVQAKPPRAKYAILAAVVILIVSLGFISRLS